MSLKKYCRRHIYRWHRITSLFIAIPVLLWTVSGFLHPVMGMFKPEVKNTTLPVTALDSATISIPLQQALAQNGIDSLVNFRIVKLYRGYYYQLEQKGFDTLTYLNCESGNVLLNGDQHYAGYLAQRFLWEENGSGAAEEHHHGKLTASIAGAVSLPSKKVTPVKAKIASIRLRKSFTSEYKASNRLLPVYEVAFDRNDGIKLFIETKADRLALASDHNKRWFTTFFAFAHSWSFLNGTGKLKSVVLGFFSALCFLSSVLGFAVYHVMKTKKKTGSTGKRMHRVFGNIFLVTTLLYAFSGAWHAFAKLPAREKTAAKHTASIAADEIRLQLSTIYPLLQKNEKLLNVSVASMNGNLYWQLHLLQNKKPVKKYVDIQTGQELRDGDALYALSLAARFMNRAGNTIAATRLVTSFDHSYSMMNKRLPVFEATFTNGEKAYIETSTASLAAVVRPSDKAERFSFSNLHMHHYWEMWLGKETGRNAKNTVLIASTLGLLLLAMTGLIILVTKKLARARK